MTCLPLDKPCTRIWCNCLQTAALQASQGSGKHAVDRQNLAGSKQRSTLEPDMVTASQALQAPAPALLDPPGTPQPHSPTAPHISQPSVGGCRCSPAPRWGRVPGCTGCSTPGVPSRQGPSRRASPGLLRRVKAPGKPPFTGPCATEGACEAPHRCMYCRRHM